MGSTLTPDEARNPVETARKVCLAGLDLLSDADLEALCPRLSVRFLREFARRMPDRRVRRCAAFLVWRYGLGPVGTWLSVHAASKLYRRRKLIRQDSR